MKIMIMQANPSTVKYTMNIYTAVENINDCTAFKYSDRQILLCMVDWRIEKNI